MSDTTFNMVVGALIGVFTGMFVTLFLAFMGARCTNRSTTSSKSTQSSHIAGVPDQPHFWNATPATSTQDDDNDDTPYIISNPQKRLPPKR